MKPRTREMLQNMAHDMPKMIFPLSMIITAFGICIWYAFFLD